MTEGSSGLVFFLFFFLFVGKIFLAREDLTRLFQCEGIDGMRG